MLKLNKYVLSLDVKDARDGLDWMSTVTDAAFPTEWLIDARRIMR